MAGGTLSGLYQSSPGLGFLLALLVLIASLWLVEAIAPEVALPMVFLLLLGVVATRPKLVAQLKALYGG